MVPRRLGASSLHADDEAHAWAAYAVDRQTTAIAAAQEAGVARSRGDANAVAAAEVSCNASVDAASTGALRAALLHDAVLGLARGARGHLALGHTLQDCVADRGAADGLAVCVRACMRAGGRAGVRACAAAVCGMLFAVRCALCAGAGAGVE